MGLMSNAARAIPNGLKAWFGMTTGGVPRSYSWPVDWWQQDRGGPNFSSSGNATVEACVAAYSQTVAQCPVEHWRERADGGRDHIKNSLALRLMRNPNDYQTRSDLILNLVRSLLLEGNAYVWLGRRDENFKPKEMHLLNPRTTRGYRIAEDGAIFYGVSLDPWHRGADLDLDSIVPARDIAHFRLHTPYDLLRGESPLTAAAMSIAANNEITGHQATFFKNMARPSGVLTTDLSLSVEQRDRLREAFEAQSAKFNTGHVPILSNGLKWEPLSITSQDAELVKAWRMSIEDIARAFRVPLMMVNSLEGSTFNNAEAAMSWWLASGLGFMLDHIELTFDKAFGLPPGEHLNFDQDVLLRTDIKTRLEALGNGVLKGIYSPNEARAIEGLPAAVEGDEPRVQQQVVPLSYYADQSARDDARLQLEIDRNDKTDEPPAEPPAEPEPDDAEKQQFSKAEIRRVMNNAA